MTDKDTSELKWFLEAEDELMQSGVVVPGAIVQANSNIFENGESDHPADLLYSLSDGMSSDELLSLASRLFGLKSQDPEDAQEARLSAHLTDEMDRSFGIEIPRSMSSLAQTYMSTTMLYRDHLPHGRLTPGIYPVLVSPKTLVAMILPLDLWTEDGYELYLRTGGHELG